MGRNLYAYHGTGKPYRLRIVTTRTIADLPLDALVRI